MVHPWERTPIRKAKGMFAYRLRYLRREEQIAEDIQKRNVWQKATPSSISLKHFSIQLLSKHHLAWCSFLMVRPWERTPVRKAKGMFAYRLRYLRREEQIAKDIQKQNVWQKVTPSSISLKKICLALVEEHHLAWCSFLMVYPWERTPIRKAKGMFAYRLRYLRREEQIAEDKQKRNVWQKATPSSISLKHFSIQLLSKTPPRVMFFTIYQEINYISDHVGVQYLTV